MPAEQWPALYQARWREALSADRAPDFFAEEVEEADDRYGNPAGWSAATRQLVREGYARFLFSVRAAGLTDAVTAENIRHFVRCSRDRGIRSSTICSDVRGIYSVARVAEPDRDWRWLRRTIDNLKRFAAGESKRKHGRIVDPGELWILGEELMEAARTLRRDDHKAAILFRNGLLLAFISAVPVRLRTVTLTEIGRHLDLDKGSLSYGVADTKERRAEFREIPEDLLRAIREYVATYRERLVRDSSCRRLWGSDQGGGLTAGRISAIIGDLTEEVLDVRVSAHLVRDCVATLIRERFPEEIEVASIILNHRDRQVTSVYFEGAKQIIAQRCFQAIRNKRKAARAAGGSPAAERQARAM